jgi:hypothetical protein
MLNYQGLALAPSLRPVNTTFAPPADPFGYGCQTTPPDDPNVTYSISGHVADSSDNSLEGVIVSSSAGTNTATDATGAYTLTGLSTGIYNVVPATEGYIFSPTLRAVVLLTDTTGIDFVGVEGVTYAISGYVRDGENNPVSSIIMSLESGQNTTTNASGAYTLTGLITGTYTVLPGEPAVPAFAFLPETGEASVSDASPHVANVDFVARTLIYGEVKDQTGNAIVGVAVTARDSGGTIVDQYTTPLEGHYRMVDLLPGSYSLTAGKEGYGFAPPEAAVTLKSVSVGEFSIEQDFLGAPNSPGKSVIGGQVIEAGSGSPIPGVNIQVELEGQIIKNVATNGSGQYIIPELSAGTYQLTPSHDNYYFLSEMVSVPPDATQDFEGQAKNAAPSPPPDPITTSGFKGANWLNLDLTIPENNYSVRNIGWNLELSPDIYRAGDPTGAQINDLYRRDVQTIVRLHVGPPIQNPGADFLNILCDDFNNWMINTVDDHYTKVINAIGEASGSSPIFILDNEPNLDWGYTAEQYAHVFNCYYQHWRALGRAQWLFAAGPGDAGGAFVQFYQELLNTGEETITDTDGFAIHAYGYCQDCNVRDTPNVDDTDYAIRNGLWESRFSDAWIDGWKDAIANRPDLQNRAVIITEYNPGRQKDEQNHEIIYVNTIRRDDEPPHEELWQDWFDKTTCWAREINTLRGLLYFVDEGAPGRNAPTTDDWYEGSLQSNPAARSAWLAASPNPDCNAVLGEELGGQGLTTVGSIGGVISGTLGVKGFNNVFYVTNNLEVPVGRTLTITMGTTLVFSPGLRMDVAGQLIAEGNTVFPVRFISTSDEGWAGLYFQPSAQGSRCLGCSLENLETGVTALTVQAPITFQYGMIRDVPGGTAISGTVPFTLTNLVIDYVDTGLRLAGSSAATYTVSHLTLGRCRQGIANQGQNITLENSILTTCDVAVSTQLAGTTSISYTLLHNNGQDFVTASDSQLNQGPGLLMTDPKFVDFPDNYQLQSDSPAVNAGNPLSDYSQELGYNGGRADLGAYGNTWQARQRPPLAQMAVSLNAATTQRVGRPGETITYTLILRNSGSVTDSYTVRIEGTRFDSRLFENGYAGPRQVQLAPQQQMPITVWVTIPLLPIQGLSSTIPVQAFNGYGVEAQVVLTASVAAFQEVGGQVVMEAERFAGQAEQSSRSWLTQTVLAGYAGFGYLSALPDTDLRFTTSYTTTSPELQYTINFTNTGVYTVWLRGYAPNGAGDSIYVGLDNQPATALSGFTPRIWSWTAKRTDTPSGAVTIAVTEPGLHVLRLWQREDGLRLDRIVLTTDGNYNPGGSGPPESEFE